jgi:hypothetical protein
MIALLRNKSNRPKQALKLCFARCTPEPRWDRFARRSGTVLRADYQDDGCPEENADDGN